jgi:predicted ATPase/class 3 adenylate cyclase
MAALGAASPEESLALCQVAACALCRPCLQSFRDNPLQTIDGRFPSVDSLEAALIAYLGRNPYAAWIDRGMSGRERPLLSAVPVVRQRIPPRGVGISWGAVFLSHSGDAVPVRIGAHYQRHSPQELWPDPIPVGVVSPDIAASARKALAAALRLIERSSLPDLPRPAPIYYALMLPVDSDILPAVAGDSLGLPLALAFLSALTGLPLRTDRGTTGALGRRDVHSVSPVERIDEKAAALQAIGVHLHAPKRTGSLLELAEPLLKDGRRLRPVAAPPEPMAGPALAGEAVPLLYVMVDQSARLWEAFPTAMRQAVAEFHERVAQTFARAQGTIIYQGGRDEGLAAVFPHVDAACDAAKDLQRALWSHLWPETGPLKVSIGLHIGPLELVRGVVIGTTLSLVHRLAEAAPPGQILMSEPAVRALSAPGTEAPIALGRHRLRDLAQPVALYRLPTPGLPDHKVPPRTLEARRHNLPANLAPLVGRREETAALITLLRERHHRLITLSGPGGVGKTRLALQVASETVDHFPDGVWLVPLETVRTENGLPLAIGQALDLAAREGRLDASVVLEALADRRALLVLDNCETVLDQVPFLADLLRAAPGITCLATSQVLLNLYGECRVDVAPLPIPAEHETADEIAEQDAVILFCARARAVSPRFSPDSKGWQRIGDICRRLDGLPLAIELAAAQVRHRSLKELDTALQRSFGPLKTTVHNVPHRHQTIQNTLAWSYGLLTDEERSFLESVSLFVGGCDGRSTAAVAEEPDADAWLARLEEKSLLRRDVVDEQTRYRLPPLIQTFVAERLAQRSDDFHTQLRNRHAAYFAQLALQACEHLYTPTETEACDALDREIENLRVTYQWLERTDRPRWISFVADLGLFLRRRGYWAELREWTATALAAVDASTRARVRARLHLTYAIARRDLADLEGAETHGNAALRFALEGEDDVLIGDALNTRGLLLIRSQQFSGAIEALQDARWRFESAGCARGVVSTLTNEAMAHFNAGDVAQAMRLSIDAVEQGRRQESARDLIMALANQGFFLFSAGEFRTATVLFEEQIALCVQLKDLFLLGMALHNAGESRWHIGDQESAIPLFVIAEQVFTRLGHPRWQIVANDLNERAAAFGEDRLAALRDRFTRLPLHELMQRELPITRKVLFSS